MEKIVAKLRADYPHISFVVGDIARWSPENQQVSYDPREQKTGTWSLLHEAGHALLDHTSYHSDVALLQKEIAAWGYAKRLAHTYGITINQAHIEECLDTYRDWLYKRSTCPTCDSHGLQQSQAAYSCLNCKSTWMVTMERFCRPYRLKSAHKTN